jgi:hypothetical protein
MDTMNTAPTEDQLPSCRDLVGLLAQTEAKVNAICGEWFDDWVSLRRALVDEGLLRRNESGTTYERV